MDVLRVVSNGGLGVSECVVVCQREFLLRANELDVQRAHCLLDLCYIKEKIVVKILG